MRKFFIVLFLCVLSSVAFGEPTYNCRYQEKQNTGFLGIGKKGWWGSDTPGYLYCGHVGTDGCKDGDVILMNSSLKRCQDHSWATIDYYYVEECEKNIDPYYYEYYVANNWVVFYNKGKDTEALAYYCKLPISDFWTRCENSGGEWESTVCNCSGDKALQREGDASFLPCECKDGFKRGDDNKCWPKEYIDGKCMKFSDALVYCPHSYGNIDGVPFAGIADKFSCIFVNSEYYRLCNDGDKIIKRNGVACPGFADKEAYDFYDKAAYEALLNHERYNDYGVDDDGYECLKLNTKYNYKSCSSGSDCAGIDNKKSPYLHSTAWKCIEQTAGVRVCAAKECETGWEPKNGYCQEKKTTQTPQPENKNLVPVVQTEKKTGVTKTCPDANMDADCRCTRVAETVERGGVCVCADSNKEIKNGKCEYTAGYVAKLGADVNNAYDGVKSIVDGLKLNVWRDADGNFNTARLASDSIAGVVLGTVGGVVTANVVKKSQVKKGLEDIQCHIGGQSVANFGDGFVVGR